MLLFAVIVLRQRVSGATIKTTFAPKHVAWGGRWSLPTPRCYADPSSRVPLLLEHRLWRPLAPESVTMAMSLAEPHARASYAAQTVAHDVFQEEQEKLKKTLAALAAAAVGLQKEKRRKLDDKLEKCAKKAMTVVDDQVRRHLGFPY